MDIKKLVGDTAQVIKEKSVKAGEDVKDGAIQLKLKIEATEVISKGIKDLKVYSDRYANGVVHDVVTEMVSDLEARKKAIIKMSEEALKVDSEDLMHLVENQKESSSENEATKKMENSALSKVYKSATAIYQNLQEAIDNLIVTYK